MELEEFFVCPKCKIKLEITEQFYKCTSCKSSYPVLHNIPVFMTGDTVSNVYSEFWDNGWQRRVGERGDEYYLIEENSEQLRDTLLKSLNRLIQSKHTIAEVVPIDNKVVLNIGCGTGEAPCFTVLGANNYIGIDYSFTAAKYSHEFIKKLGGSGITVQANAESLPIEKDSIDLVYSNGVLHHTPNTQQTLDEIVRVLKPSGRGVIGLYNTYSPKFFNQRIIGTVRSAVSKRLGKWYEYGEDAWRTGNNTNPWTKTYSRKELKVMFCKYDTIEDLSFRKTTFSWGSTIPKLGKYIDKTKLGKLFAKYLQDKLDALWVITFKKTPAASVFSRCEIIDAVRD